MQEMMDLNTVYRLRGLSLFTGSGGYRCFIFLFLLGGACYKMKTPSDRGLHNSKVL